MFYETFCRLCNQKGVSPTKACLEMGLSKAAATKWKNTGATPNGATLSKIAAYFGVSADRLLAPAGQENTPGDAAGGAKVSIEERAEQILSGLSDGSTLMLDGKPASEEAKEAFRHAIEAAVAYARQVNDKKESP